MQEQLGDFWDGIRSVDCLNPPVPKFPKGVLRIAFCLLGDEHHTIRVYRNIIYLKIYLIIIISLLWLMKFIYIEMHPMRVHRLHFQLSMTVDVTALPEGCITNTS